jgi:GNAT superfamily N-acetyltransferase
MRVVVNPPYEELLALQNDLDREGLVGLFDIWGTHLLFQLAARTEDAIVGVATITLISETPEIYKIYVAPPSRRTGAAKMLFEASIEQLREHGFKEAFCEAATEAGLRFLENATLCHDVENIGDGRFLIRLAQG